MKIFPMTVRLLTCSDTITAFTIQTLINTDETSCFVLVKSYTTYSLKLKQINGQIYDQQTADLDLYIVQPAHH